MRKPDFCLGENKGADQLCSNRQADQCFCFHSSNSTISLNFKLLACFCACTARFVSDMVGKPEDQFSGVLAQMFCIALA